MSCKEQYEMRKPLLLGRQIRNNFVVQEKLHKDVMVELRQIAKFYKIKQVKDLIHTKKIFYSHSVFIVDEKRFDSFTYSDENFKINVKPMDNALNKIKGLQGVTYNWKNDGANEIGFIAQDVEKIIPEVVRTTGEEGGYAMDYSRMTALLVEGIKEQQAQIETLRAELAKKSDK